jgi:DNA-binding MarR family transcriptional regulator
VLQYDFEESIGYWVVMTAHALQRALNEELARHGITFRQWEVLAWLALQGELAQAELAERMGIEAPTLAGILDRMQRDGWIVRRTCPTDRRKKLVRPTRQVKPVWSRMVQCAHRVRTRAVERIDPEQIEQLKTLLGTMQENLRTFDWVETACENTVGTPERDHLMRNTP